LIDSRAIYVITLRELIKLGRQRGSLINTFARPILWLFVVGSGLNQIVQMGGPVSYKQFMFPGVMGMVILFSSIFSSISIVWDREFGFLREILVAPISRLSIVIGKAISGTLSSSLQAAVIMIFLPLLGIHVRIPQLLGLMALAVLLSFALTSLGILIAAHMETFGVFNVIMNLLVMPLFFLSGAIYPVTLLPSALRFLSRCNPLTYGIDAFKHMLLPKIGAGGHGALGAEFPLGFDILIVAFFSLVMISLAVISFRKIQ
jgi:ABC-2 type transport system permease protein